MAESPKTSKRPSAAPADAQPTMGNSSLLRSLASPSDEIRKAAVMTALKMRDRRAIEPLLMILKGKDADARLHAARSLALIPSHAESLPLLYDALKHNDAFVRAAVGRTLGKWGLRESVPWLIRALTDHESEVCNVVVKALGRLGEVRWEKWLSAAPKFGHKTGVTREQHLLNTLSEDLRNAPSPQQRVLAAQALVLFRSPQVVSELERALGDGIAEVRTSAVESLGKAGDKRVMNKLIHMLDDTEKSVRSAAKAALDTLDALPG